MICPSCGVNKDKVIDSRAADQGKVIRRRRECQACRKRFTTRELIETSTRLTVIKRDGSRVPYDRQNLLSGLEKACYKRPVSTESLTRLVDEVEEDVFRRYDREVEAIELGRSLAQRLKNLDHVAYVRFASVYKQFRDLDDFLEEVREVLESTDDESPTQGFLFQ
jgi:transcriptional repressor NrdR